MDDGAIVLLILYGELADSSGVAELSFNAFEVTATAEM